MAIISSDCKILVTVGREDKAIVLWEIKNFDISQWEPSHLIVATDINNTIIIILITTISSLIHPPNRPTIALI